MQGPFASQWLSLTKRHLESNAPRGTLVAVVSPSGRGKLGTVRNLTDSHLELKNGDQTSLVSLSQRGLRFAVLPLPDGMEFGHQKILPL